MSPRKRKTRLYWKRGRAYGDFRDYADVGGGREALIPPAGKRATTDTDLAIYLAGKRTQELERLRRSKAFLGISRQATIAVMVASHLEALEAAGRVERHVANFRHQLAVATEFFGADRLLHTIGKPDLRAYLKCLRERDGKRGRPLATGTLRHYLVALSGLFVHAQDEDVVPEGQNPVLALRERPAAADPDAAWMEHDEASAFLEAARRTAAALPYLPIYPIVATFLLTGGRMAEVLGLDRLADVSFDRRVIEFRPNDFRRIKTRASRRTVPLWPELEVILREYEDEWTPGQLLFTDRRRRDSVIADLRKELDTVTETAVQVAREREIRFRYGVGKVRTRIFRHTYCAARLQTLDHGAPVSIYTVSREMGHASTSTTERIYAHLGTVRHRSEAVEYRLPAGAVEVRA